MAPTWASSLDRVAGTTCTAPAHPPTRPPTRAAGENAGVALRGLFIM